MPDSITGFRPPQSGLSRLTHCARTGHVHGIDLEAVQAGADGGIVFAELPGFPLVHYLEYPQTESSTGSHHRTIKKQLAGVKALPEIVAVLIHQGPLWVSDVPREGRPGRNQLEIVMLFVHGENIIPQCFGESDIPSIRKPGRN